MNFHGGKTAHTTFRILIKDDPRDLQKLLLNVSPNFKLAHFLRRVDSSVWDEFANNRKMSFHAVDAILRKIRYEFSLPCGGILINTCRHFRQIPPRRPFHKIDGKKKFFRLQ